MKQWIEKVIGDVTIIENMISEDYFTDDRALEILKIATLQKISSSLEDIRSTLNDMHL
jgi:hypothetical protein